MRILIAAISFLAVGSTAQAYCFPVPDTAQTSYVANDLNRTLCLHRELAGATAQRNLQNEINATIGKLQRDALQQRLTLQQQQHLDLMDDLPSR